MVSTADSMNDAIERARSLVAERRPAEAATALRDIAPDDPSGEAYAMLGLSAFLMQDYSGAARHYGSALERDTSNEDWRVMQATAQANALARVDVHVPPPHHWERDALLAPPAMPKGLPSPPQATELALPKRVLRALGNVTGEVVTVGFNGLIRVYGRLAGYKDEIWTNWYRRRVFLGVLTLAYMRERLNKNNLKAAYPKSTLVAFQPSGQVPPPGVTHFRTADGSWNNLENPREGSAGTRFPRNVASAAIRPETGKRLLTPSPREVSRKLLAREGEMKEVPFLNLLAASWIDFQNHDWISHGETLTRDLIEIPVSPDDPARTRFHQRAIYVAKTQPDPTRRDTGEPSPTSFINEVTHWWDGSQIYGSDQATVDRLRSHADGKLTVEPDGRLPIGSGDVEDTGFRRNWWVGLSMLHTLFVLEHNAICDRLKSAHRDWDDERLFQVARLVNAAVMAKIHSVEWTPAILPNPALNDALQSNWYGFLTNALRRGTKRTLAPFNVKNPELGGVVGNPLNAHECAYGLTQEFVEVYRLHSLLPEAIEVRSADGSIEEDVPFIAVRQAGSAKLTARVPMKDLFHSFGVQHPGALVLGNFPRFLQHLSIPGNPVFDIGAVDVLRARERGVPRYNEFRRQLGLNPIQNWEDLTSDPETLARLREVYGEAGVEDLDLLVGTLGEDTRPTGFGFGETLFQIFILNATRRLQADRFYTTNYNEETYTKEGLQWVDDADLKHVILRHYPELASTGLANVKNAFEPWDRGERLDPERHPLRAFDRSLKGDRWAPGDGR